MPKNDASRSLLQGILERLIEEQSHGQTRQYWTLYQQYILAESELNRTGCRQLVNDILVSEPDFVDLIMQSVKDEGVIYYRTITGGRK